MMLQTVHDGGSFSKASLQLVEILHAQFGVMLMPRPIAIDDGEGHGHVGVRQVGASV